MDINELHQLLTKKGLGFSDVEICEKKDDEFIDGKLKDIIKAIFDISQFDDDCKSVLKHMPLIPAHGIKLDFFKLLGGDINNKVIFLKEIRWVIMDEVNKTISLHPLVLEVILDNDETKPTFDNCSGFFKNILNILDDNEKLKSYTNFPSLVHSAFSRIGFYDVKNGVTIEDMQEICKKILTVLPYALTEAEDDAILRFTTF